MPSNNLSILRELTHSLTLQDMVRTRAADWIRYDTEKGNCLGLCLLHERTVAVQKSFMSRGTVFPKHVHEEVELLIIYEGALSLDGKEYHVSDIVRIPANQEHRVIALEDTWMVAVTIPASSAYPDVRDCGKN